MIALVDGPIDVEAVLRAVEGDGQGGVVLFVGRVRDRSGGRTVTHLEYEAYAPMARRELASLAARAQEQHGAERVALVHRLGRLEIGEAAVAIAVAAAHRDAAFAACRWLIDTLKQTVPIWKRECFVDGDVWVTARP